MTAPAFAIGTCAWFEEKWLQTIPAQDRWRIEGVRYMDDVLMVVNDKGWGKADAWFGAIEKVGGCYPAPLSLKQDDGKHYLECTIHNQGDDMLLQHSDNIGIKMEEMGVNKGFIKVFMLIVIMKRGTRGGQ